MLISVKNFYARSASEISMIHLLKPHTHYGIYVYIKDMNTIQYGNNETCGVGYIPISIPK